MRRHVLFPFLVILALSGAELRPQGGPSLAFEIGCGALVGLDRPLRGAYAEALLELDALGMTGGLQGAFVYDAGFGACLLAGDLVIGLGPDLRLVAGGELPLGARKTLASTGAALAPALARALAPSPWPSRFALSVLLAELRTRPGSSPRLLVGAELGWSAYSLVDSGGGPASSLAVFAAGLRIRAGARLRWGGTVRPSSPP